MSDEEKGDAQVALTEEGRLYEDAKRRYDEAGRSLDEAREALQQWKANHEESEHTLSNRDLLQLKKDVKDADQQLQNAHERLKDARAAAEKESQQSAIPIHPDAQKQLWKSVVRISLSPLDFSVSTGVVVDRTSTHVYLLTNLHLWMDEYFADFLSTEFANDVRELKSILEIKKSPIMKRKADKATQPKRKASSTIMNDQPEIQVEQVQDLAMVNVLAFKLDRTICWRSSADFDYAIFRLALPEDELPLISCPMSTDVYTTMNVHILGVPAALVEQKFGHAFAMIPAQITGMDRNQMTLTALSAPGLSGSAIICTHRGVLVGYLGGALDCSKKSEQYQSYGYTLQGLPQMLPRYLTSGRS